MPLCGLRRAKHGNERPQGLGSMSSWLVCNDADSVLCVLIAYCHRRCVQMSRSQMLTKWFLSSRLETRTKESSMYASIRVKNPGCEMKVKDRVRGLRCQTARFAVQ